MSCFSHLLLAATVAVAALAAPTDPALVKKRSFTVPVVRANGFNKDPVQAMRHAALKYGWDIVPFNPQADPIAALTNLLSDLSPPAMPSSGTVPSTSTAPTSIETLANSASAQSTQAPTSTQQAATSSSTATVGSEDGEVSAVPEQNDSEYLSSVTIGGSQTFNLDFDTGSADLWVFSVGLPSSEDSGHSLFDPSKSSTWKTYSSGSWNISYGDGSGASGTVGFDTVDVGGATVKSQAVELATQVDTSFMRDANNDGLLGLAFSSLNTITPSSQKTFFENLAPQLTSPLFTADLEDTAAGTYEFGRIDSTKYTGEIQYTSIDKSSGFWQFASPTFSITGGNSSSSSNSNNSSSKQTCQTCSPAIADTGTSLVLLDEDVVQTFYASVAGAEFSQSSGGYVYPCTSAVPDLGLALGDGAFVTLQGSQTTYKALGDGSCFGGVQGNSGQGVQVFGDVFFKQFFAVFDGTEGQERFGVAAKN